MPISFSCPYCGVATIVADQYAGQSGPCKGCGKQITVPRPETTGTVETRPGKGGTMGCTIAAIVAAVLVGGIVVMGILVPLLLPAIQMAREAARRTQCTNNLNQIALAMHNYHSAYGSFPPAYIADENGKPIHSWRVLILPFLEAQGLYDQYDFSQPWDSAQNQLLAAQMPVVFACPSDSTGGGTTTNYLAVVGPETIFPGAKSVSIQQITDGTSNTIMVVEAEGGSVNWLEPTDIDIDELTNRQSGSYHPGGYNVGLADGSVQYLTDSMLSEQLRSMATAAGGEEIPPTF